LFGQSARSDGPFISPQTASLPDKENPADEDSGGEVLIDTSKPDFARRPLSSRGLRSRKLIA